MIKTCLLFDQLFRLVTNNPMIHCPIDIYYLLLEYLLPINEGTINFRLNNVHNYRHKLPSKELLEDISLLYNYTISNNEYSFIEAFNTDIYDCNEFNNNYINANKYLSPLKKINGISCIGIINLIRKVFDNKLYFEYKPPYTGQVIEDNMNVINPGILIIYKINNNDNIMNYQSIIDIIHNDIFKLKYILEDIHNELDNNIFKNDIVGFIWSNTNNESEYGRLFYKPSNNYYICTKYNLLYNLL